VQAKKKYACHFNKVSQTNFPKAIRFHGKEIKLKTLYNLPFQFLKQLFLAVFSECSMLHCHMSRIYFHTRAVGKTACSTIFGA
jgi:hypothetical protein